MDTTPPKDVSNSGRERSGWIAPLIGAIGAILVILVARAVTSDLLIHPTVAQRSCQGGFCVERVHTPDLLFVPARQEVHVKQEGTGKTQGRYYTARDPFDEFSDVQIVWKDGAVHLSDGAAILAWDADTLGRLDN
jgi:hypothetical protein